MPNFFFGGFAAYKFTNVFVREKKPSPAVFFISIKNTLLMMTCTVPLSGWDFHGVCISNCTLQAANLIGSDLRGADLSQADLKVHVHQLSGAGTSICIFI